MDIDWIVLAILGCACVGYYAYAKAMKLEQTRDIAQCEREVEVWLSEYRTKLTGSNRFLISEQLLATAFPEYSPNVIKQVWLSIVNRRMVDRDPLDGEMCIK